MQITVHRPDLEQFVEAKVESGEYPTPDAVVEDALVRLRSEQGDGDWSTDELREAVHVGLEQLARGEGVELNGDQELDAFFDDIKRAGRERHGQEPTPR
ncbi:MAG: type II toxin-antitoxin system ParD family antitoxin [Planctomycetes bacterium]|nr:type II toxin-antitoxin system ParD family antitoxin [Planctomycetota bacterium]